MRNRIKNKLGIKWVDRLWIVAWAVWAMSLAESIPGTWEFLAVPAVVAWLAPSHWIRRQPEPEQDDDENPLAEFLAMVQRVVAEQAEGPHRGNFTDDEGLPLDVTVLMAQLREFPPHMKPMAVASLWQRLYGEEDFDPTRSVHELHEEVVVAINLMRSAD